MKTFYWLVKREFWEHRGGFLWTPVIVGGLSLLLTLMSLVTGEVLGRRNNLFRFDGGDSIGLNGHLDASMLDNVGGVLDCVLFGVIALMLGIMAIVVFFYCLGSLYNDRRDRSILFWKSLPISDGQTVLAKVTSATLVAPVIACSVGVITGLLMMVMVACVASIHGLNLWQLLLHVHPLQVIASVIALIPLYVIWALPTAGWLMLCSAWSRSMPFLWALLLPPASLLIVWWFGLLGLFKVGAGWFWGNVVVRLLMSLVPGGWLRDVPTLGNGLHANTPDALLDFLGVAQNYATLVSPDLWIGAIAGVVMIAAATWLRRWRDDS
ncbi:hypothetical protein [Rhodanobacter sp. MP1X3]|uniref:hypothetical protein n=1 Tax=Rhodanobacter sp. MP1X3 TaxID=2723086 RepID=UPI00161AC547|nr:hypothetical protein [Rhodanobacter sp. MP1X3]MBB6244605.1 ABC-2 type transport system permease protein [Rhodanobacter sp. MP1X3]